MAKNRIGFSSDFVLKDREVGIGTTNPLQTLHIEGNFLVAAGTTTGKHITLKPYDTNNGTLSWEGSAGQLFSITNNLTEGSVFSINDSSAVPIVDALANGTLQLVPYGGEVAIGKTLPEHTVDIRGDLRADAVSNGPFNIGITSSIYVPVTAGIGTNAIQTRNIFVGPGIAYSFPSTVSRTYVIESIHITNKSGNELYITGRQDYNGGSNVPIANRVIVPYQGSLELLEQPTVANPQDIIRLQALTSQGTDAEGHNGGIDAFIVISEKQVNDFIGTGATITSADQEVFKTVTKSSVIQSVRLTNYDNNIDVDASVSVFRNASAVGGGVRLGYLAFNLTVPKNSVVEIIQNPKYLQIDDAIKVSASSSNTLAVTIAGKYIK
jgi:hypothetical protein